MLLFAPQILAEKKTIFAFFICKLRFLINLGKMGTFERTVKYGPMAQLLSSSPLLSAQVERRSSPVLEVEGG